MPYHFQTAAKFGLVSTRSASNSGMPRPSPQPPQISPKTHLSRPKRVGSGLSIRRDETKRPPVASALVREFRFLTSEQWAPVTFKLTCRFRPFHMVRNIAPTNGVANAYSLEADAGRAHLRRRIGQFACFWRSCAGQD